MARPARQHLEIAVRVQDRQIGTVRSRPDETVDHLALRALRQISTRLEESIFGCDAARQLGGSFRDLYDLIHARELPAYKIDRDIKLRQADIDDYRRAHPTLA